MPGTTPILNLPYPVPGDTVDVPRDVKALADAVDPLGTIPVGGILMWPTAVEPNGWLFCKGQTTIPAATYPKLAAVLGATGGFVNMPNFTDLFPIGAGANALLATGGAASVALTGAQTGAHSHGVNDGGHNHGGATGFSAQNLDHQHDFGTYVMASNPPVTFLPTTLTGSGVLVPVALGGGGSTNNLSGPVSGGPGVLNNHAHSIPNGATGISIQNNAAAAGHENRPPFRAINFIVRAV